MTDRTIREEIGSISKMFLGGLVVVAAMAAGGAFGLRAVFQEYQSSAKESLNASAIFEDVFEARLDGLKWRKTGDPQHSDGFFGNVDEVLNLPPEAASDQMRADLAGMQSMMRDYSAQFERIAGKEQTYQAQLTEIDRLGRDARLGLTSVIESATGREAPELALVGARAQEALMLGRLYLQKYEGSEDVADFNTAIGHIATAQDAAAQLVTLANGTSEARGSRAAQEAIDQLRSSAELLIALVRDRVDAKAAMDAIGPQMVAEIELVVDGIVANQRQLGVQGDWIALATVVLIAMASGAIIYFGWRMARRRADALVSELDAAVDTMSKIADGDLDAEVRNSEMENELGQIARALDVFKGNGKAAIAAAEREKAQERERKKQAEEAALAESRREEAARAEAERLRQEMTADLGRSIGSVVNAASAGNFTKRVAADFADPELVRLAGSVNSLVETVETGLSEVATVLTHLKDGDLTRRMDGRFEGTFADVQDSLNSSMDTLSELIAKISEQSGTVLTHASSMSQGAADLSQRAVKQAASLEETAAAMEQVSASAKHGENSAGQASSNAVQTRQEVAIANQTMQDAIATMEAIKADSQKIAEIVDVIDSIAVQTSLLSLNASVEAARAGDAGKGFAVVASEVRGLAVRSAEASKDIATLIEQSTRGIEAGVEKVKDTGQALSGVERHVSEMATLMEDLAESGKQQAAAIHEVTNAMSDMDRTTQSNATLADETNVSARTLSQEANATQNLLSTFVIDKRATDRTGVGHAA